MKIHIKWSLVPRKVKGRAIKRLESYFVVKAKNGKNIATSEHYATYRACLRAAKLFNLPIIDKRTLQEYLELPEVKAK